MFAALCLACLVVAAGYVAWAIFRDEPGNPGAGGQIGDLNSPGTIARISAPRGGLLFQNLVPGDHWNQVGIVSPDEVGGSRTMLPLRCLRVDYAAGRGLCLAEGKGLPGTYAAYIFDGDSTVLDDIRLGGLPSRTRVSPDGRYGASTSFVTGHSYAEEGFSTETLLIDLHNDSVIANLEDFTSYRDGQAFEEETTNYWGVTFEDDSNRFFVTIAFLGKTYLAEGNIAEKSITILHDNVECPSLSPDNTRIAYKKQVGSGLGGSVWRFHVLDLATMTETPLAETRSIDDQIEWLDNDNVLYGDGTDTWTVPADGSGEPRRFMSHALSLSVVPGSGDDASGTPAASDAAPGNDTLVLPDADLGVTAVVEPASIEPGGQFTMTVTITNHGPNDATWLTVETTLPPGVTYVSAVSTDPPGMDYGCGLGGDGDQVKCDTPALASGQSWTTVITATAGSAGTYESRVDLSAVEADPNPKNDSTTMPIVVGP